MSAAAVKPRPCAKPATANRATVPPAVSPTEADFIRGRDIAVMMLREGYGFRDCNETAGKRCHRGGGPQERFTKGYLRDLLKEPALLDGFAAVLSAAIGTDSLHDFESYGALPMAEFQAGEVGADGTQPEEQQSLAGTIVASGKASFFASTTLQDACQQICQAVEFLDVLAQHVDSQACWAASRLLDAAAVQIAKSIGSKDCEDADEGWTMLGEALAVMKMIGDMDHTIPIGGAITLVDLARNAIDSTKERRS